MDDSGWPIAVRVGRHASTVLQTLETFNTMETPERQILVSGVPRYAELVDKGLGAFFRDPSGVSEDASSTSDVFGKAGGGHLLYRG
jgi:hypothetical protein